MTALVEARDLSLPGRLHPTSLNLADGELVCLIGPNGSGKTSLLHALAGIGSPAGEVQVDGENPKGLHPHRRQRLLTFLPASRDIKWPLKAKDVITLGRPAGSDAASTDLALDDLLERRVDQLSTGERSRVLIARALAARPRLLLLDEPIANLDPLWQLRLMDHLEERTRADGQAVLLAVHDLDVARRYAERLIVMNEGRIVADGDPASVFEGPDIPQVFGVEWVEGSWQPAR
jgi:iron complex transport system ATP-binding protein